MPAVGTAIGAVTEQTAREQVAACLLYTSDAADERSSVDLGGRRIIKKKKTRSIARTSLCKTGDIEPEE